MHFYIHAARDVGPHGIPRSKARALLPAGGFDNENRESEKGNAFGDSRWFADGHQRVARPGFQGKGSGPK
jgi:hypothetical protein